VIWRSSLIPSGVLVVRAGMEPVLRKQLMDFMLGYGKGGGAAGERERDNLARIPDLAGFVPATSLVLRSFSDMEYTLQRQQALHGRWVSDAARDARLRQVEADHRQVLQQLQAH